MICIRFWYCGPQAVHSQENLRLKCIGQMDKMRKKILFITSLHVHSQLSKNRIHLIFESIEIDKCIHLFLC